MRCQSSVLNTSFPAKRQKAFSRTPLAVFVAVIAAGTSVPVFSASDVAVRLKTKNLVLPVEKISRTVESGQSSYEEKSVRTINGKKYTFIKNIKEDETVVQVFDHAGKEIRPELVPAGRIQRIDPKILKWVSNIKNSGDIKSTLKVDIALNLPVKPADDPVEVGEAEVLDGQTIGGQINDRKFKGDELNDYSNELAKKQTEKLIEQAKLVSVALARWAKQSGLSNAKGMKEALLQAGTVVTLDLTYQQLERVLEAKDKTIAGIEVTPEVKDTINGAMADTNILNWALPNAATRGDDIGIYMTESGCAQDSRFSGYDRLAGSETNHSRNVGGIIKAASPDSYLYCRGGAVLPQISDLDGVGGNPEIYVVNRSNGGNYTTSYNTTDRSWDDFAYNYALAMHVSAGNEGNRGGHVISPAKGLNITSVGNYNDATDTISSGSSFLDPATGNDKPEVSAPGTNISAGGFTMSGTSMSSPHAAAFTADMMSSSTYLKYRPYLAKAKLMAGATDPIAGGYDTVGVGGIDFLSSQWSGYWSWWSGGNGSWNYFDGLDGNNDGYVTRTVYISSGWDRVRVALAWMNRGSYTYDHRNDAHPIGQDLDLRVYNPNGSWIGSSASWDNPFETVSFTPTISGYYTFKVKRYANRDTGAAVRMGMYVNYYNE